MIEGRPGCARDTSQGTRRSPQLGDTQTPPGDNQGPAGLAVPAWSPALRKTENRINMVLVVKL